MINPDLQLLQPYPFEKLRRLLNGITPAPQTEISLSVGEPKHAAPQIARQALCDSLNTLEQYPSTKGSDALRTAIASWLVNRFHLDRVEQLAQENILPVNGTREGLFAIAQCLLDKTADQRQVLMPNPFYQIYEGATLLAGCEPNFYAIDENADHNLDAIHDDDLDQAQLIYVCTPGNPTGAVNSMAGLQRLIEKAHSHNFVIVSDECYSEIYRESSGPPTGLLEAAYQMGNTDYSRCLAFHSLSKRSNLPGLRSGFVAGDKTLISAFAQYRTYHGCSMSGTVQSASIAAWSDEQHVVENRSLYDQKYQAVTSILASKVQLKTPPAGFYLWPDFNCDDEQFTQRLLAEQNVRVVPGSYLARANSALNDDEDNPGRNHLRLALVAPLEECKEAAERIIQCL